MSENKLCEGESREPAGLHVGGWAAPPRSPRTLLHPKTPTAGLPPESTFAGKAIRLFAGHPDLRRLLAHEQRVALFGCDNRAAFFLCKLCPQGCVCCDDTERFGPAEIVAHLETAHGVYEV